MLDALKRRNLLNPKTQRTHPPQIKVEPHSRQCCSLSSMAGLGGSMFRRGG